MASLNEKENASRVEITELHETKPSRKNGHCDAKTPSKKDEGRTSKYESFCKIVAVIIVVVAFVFHVLRGAKEGGS